MLMEKSLRELRKEQNKTLEQVSHDLSMALSTVCKYERGSQRIPESKKAIFCDYYGVSSFRVNENRYITLCDTINSLKRELIESNSIIRQLNKKNKALEKTLDSKNKEIELIKSLLKKL